MNVKFYNIVDLYEEVKDFPFGMQPRTNVVRMQFLTRSISQALGSDEISVPVTEQIVTLTIARGDDIYTYSEPFMRYITYDSKHARVEEAVEKVEARVKEVFKDWEIKKGVYVHP